MILGVLDQLRVLDTMGVQKGELTKPDRCVFRVWGFGFGVDVRLWKGELADKAGKVRIERRASTEKPCDSAWFTS